MQSPEFNLNYDSEKLRQVDYFDDIIFGLKATQVKDCSDDLSPVPYLMYKNNRKIAGLKSKVIFNSFTTTC